MKINFEKSKNTLPYASEIFGVYQPLLGWKSKRVEQRIAKGFMRDKNSFLDLLLKEFRGNYTVNFFESDCAVEIGHVLPGTIPLSPSYRSIVVEALAEKLPPIDRYKDKIWQELINEDTLKEILNNKVKEYAQTQYRDICTRYKEFAHVARVQSNVPEESIKQLLERESILSGALLYMRDNALNTQLKEIFYGKRDTNHLMNLIAAMKYSDPFETMDPKKDLDRVGLSPIGIVHLFRQYFFEFDTFLGTPTGHIWLSPGSTVELIEVSTRKTITERSTEISTETIVKTEKSVTEQDEISDAVKEDNKTDTRFGANVNANQSWVWGSANESASFDLNETQQTAREQSHKHMRQQSEKLSTEIRKNFKSTFKTITEVTDTSSKRYLLTNTTPELINYELHRKMRQVGVQVQDIGTYLCWQTYVDDPGRHLGVAKLMHIAQSPSLDNIPHPEQLVPLKPIMNDVTISVPFVGIDTSDNDQSYTNGSETEVADVFDSTEHILADFPQEVTCEQASYKLSHVELSPQGANAKVSVKDNKIEQDPNDNKAKFIVHLDYVDFKGQGSINIKAKLYWEPIQDLKAIEDENKKRLAQFTAKQEMEYKKSYVEAAQERINAASNIQQRNYEDLREEERIVVYRVLIQDLLMHGITMPDDRTRHIVSELINSIFDVEKMLYFVAPEWWRPRLHASNQNFGSLVAEKNSDGTTKLGPDGKPSMIPVANTNISDENIVGWGGIQEARPDNYYITKDSTRAKLGSSLGWLLQLDGDNLRNAFLNAPWVKAVIPIRPGKEKAAMNWLKQVEGMNGIGSTDMYTGKEIGLQGKTMLEVLDILAEKVAEKHKNATTTKDFPDPENPTDTSNTVSATPVDKVYEHGFYPLQGGFKANVDEQFEVFDQWIEILPTDQVVAVEVKYDPKTGKQI